MKLTGSQFIAGLAIVALLVLAVLACSVLAQAGSLLVAVPTCIAIAGIVPFSIGLLAQILFRKTAIPSFAAWALAFVLVSLQWLLTRTTSVAISGQPLLGFIGSVLIAGIFVDAAIKSCRAFRQGRKEVAAQQARSKEV